MRQGGSHAAGRRSLVGLLIVLMVCVITSHAQTQRFQVVGNVRFATLDNIDPADTTSGTPSQFSSVPAGWTIAQSNQNTVTAASSFRWGSDCLIVADGSMLPTNSGVSCSSGFMVQDVSGNFRPLIKRVFIQQAVGVINSVVPVSGPVAGGNLVTITGLGLGSGNDVTSVQLAGIAATIRSQSDSQIVVQAGQATGPVTGAAVVLSTTRGSTSLGNAYSYAVAGRIQSVNPSSGPGAGGNTVTVIGLGIGSGTDITSVTLNGVPASIQSQTADSVVVVASPGTQGTGAVSLVSTSRGTLSVANAYTFNAAPSIISVAPLSGPATGGTTVTITGQLGDGTDIVSVRINNVPCTIVSQTAGQVVVQTAAASGTGPVTIVSTSYGTATSTSVFSFLGGGSISSVRPSAVGATGGTSVTITGDNLGSGTDISRVELAGVAATIQSQTATEVVVIAAAGTARTGDVVVTSSSRGTSRLTNAITYIASGTITSLVPAVAPVSGGATITINGLSLGSGSDITSVSLAGFAAKIVSQSTSQVVVTTSMGTAISGTVFVQSVSVGTTSLQNAFTYLDPGTVTSATPASVVSGSNTQVTIAGTNLGSGSDITAVLLANIPATIVSQTATQVVVTPGVSSVVSGGTILVRSASRGSSFLANAFAYTAAVGAASVTPSFGPESGGIVVQITAAANAVLGSGTDITTVTLNGVSAAILNQTATTVNVRAGAAINSGTGDVVIIATSRTTTLQRFFTYSESGVINTVSPAGALSSTQRTVSITGSMLGDGTDISSVTLSGVPASIVSQSPDMVVVITGLGGTGQGDVLVTSRSSGVTRLIEGFTYNDTSASLPHISFHGKRYAVLEGTNPTDAGSGCSDKMLPLPDGWQLAPDTPETRLAILGPTNQFGTTCLILSSGQGVASNNLASCGLNMLIQQGNVYMSARCPGRILITRDAPGDADTWTPQVPHISNYVVFQGNAYATIDNAPAAQQTYGCSGTALQVPTGWTIAAHDAAALQVASQFVWGTACLVLADGFAATHSGAACGPDPNQLLTLQNYYSVLFCQSRILIQAPLPVPLPAPTARTLGMRLLFVSPTGDAADVSLGVATRAAQMFGTHYDVWAATPSTSTPSTVKTGDLVSLLSKSGDEGNYFGIVVSQYALVAQNADVSNVLTGYCRQFRVNMVFLSSYPTPSLGVTLNAAAPGGSSASNIRIADAFRSQKSVSGITTNHTVPVSGVFRYPVIISDSSITRPVLEFVNSNNTLEGVAAIIVDPSDGHEEMHFMWSQAAWSFPSIMYSQVWFQWLTNGLYVGARRVALNVQVDDLFLPTRAWDPTTNASTGTAFRVSPAQMVAFSNYLTQLNANLPATSNVTVEFAMNGLGVEQAGGPTTDALFQQFLTYSTRFWFLTHGYTHLNLTVSDVTHLPTTYQDTYTEFFRNEQLIHQSILTVPERWAYYSNASVITPAITGMYNGNALRALWDLGFRFLTGDNSRPDLVADNIYQCKTTTLAANGFAGMLIVPRFSTAVYYDTGLPAECVNEYNFLNRAFWGRDLTLDEIMQVEAPRTTLNLMSFRHDNYMFHQPNLRTFTWTDPITKQPDTFSLLSLWYRYLQQELNKYNTLPVRNHKQEWTAQRCLQRITRDNCDVSVKAMIDSSNRVVALDFAGTGSCTLGVTGAAMTPVDGVTQETYGPDITAWVRVQPTASGSVLTLATPVTWNS